MIWDASQYLIIDPQDERINWKPMPYVRYRSLVKSDAELALINKRLEKRKAYDQAYTAARREARGTKG